MMEDKHNGLKKVRIHVDHKPYESDSPTTGAHLYKIGEVAKNRELFKEVSGDREDVFIPNDQSEVHLIQDEHFYSQKEIVIIVNAEKKTTVETSLSFDEVVNLAYPVPLVGQNVLFTITYRNGPHGQETGDLTQGHSVRIKKGMVFNVSPTDKS